MWKPSLLRSNDARPPVDEVDAPAEAGAALRVEGVTVKYGPSVAVEGVTFSVRVGEITGLIGPNGAGKSSLLKALVGLAPLAGGLVAYEGRARATGNVAYLPQRETIEWSFPVSVFDVVLMGRTKSLGWLRRPGGADRSAVLSALVRVGMDALATRQIGSLSGGEQQRVMIARAIAQGAGLLLFDEPFRGLDVAAQETLVRILRDLRQEGRSIVVATHDLGQAADMCDSLVLLSTTLVAAGSPSTVLTPENLRVAYGSQVFVAGGQLVGVDHVS